MNASYQTSLVNRHIRRFTGAVVTGGVSRAHVQRCPHTALLYLRNGLTDCVQIWYVGWGSLTKCLPQVIGGVHLHVRTPFP